MDKKYTLKDIELTYIETEKIPKVNLNEVSNLVENKTILTFHNCEKIGEYFYADEMKLQQIIDDGIEILASTPEKLKIFLENMFSLQYNFRDYRRTLKKEIVEEPIQYDVRLLGINPHNKIKSPAQSNLDLEKKIV